MPPTKKLRWILTRHPMLFYIRFALICRNLKKGERLPEFADVNKKEDSPADFGHVNREMAIDPNADSLDRALDIARHLRKRIKGGPGVGRSSAVTLDKMLNGTAGICSDYAQLFNVFCLINDIRVREWGCVETFYKPVYGHSFNEVYSQKLAKWVMIDVGKNLYFTNGADDVPLSVIELFQSLRDGNSLHFTHFSDYVCADMPKIRLNYSPIMAPFVIENYNNKVYDHYLDRYYGKIPGFLTNALMILRRVHHRFVFPMDDYRQLLLGKKRV